jgi:hypothetical protein
MMTVLSKTAIRSATALLTLSAVMGCNGSNPSTPTPQQPSGNPAQVSSNGPAPTNYVQTTNLSLFKTDDILDGSKSNKVTISGQGPTSTYKVQYNFNSGDTTRLKLMELTQSSNYTGCTSLPSAQAILRQGGTSQNISETSIIAVSPYTDYVLEIQQSQNCASLSMTIDPIVWTDASPFTTPYLSRKCSDQKGEQIAFFPINGATGYTSFDSEKPFVGGAEFCGNTFVQTPGNCSWDLGSGGYFSDQVTCVGGATGNQRSYELNFEAAKGTGELDCKNNGNVTFSENLSNCQDAILDLNQYQKSP